MRAHYWSNSKIANLIRGTPKISIGTLDEWRDWEQTAKSAHSFRFWLAEDGLDLLQRFFYWPSDRFRDIRAYINNRWITRSHCLTAHPRDIKPGSWRDVGDRFLPCMFNELVDFVEIENAWMLVAFDDEARKKYQTPWWRTNFLRLRAWRCAEAGVESLERETKLICDEEWGYNSSSENYGKPMPQAIAAQEILDLYRWWKEVRRGRAGQEYDFTSEEYEKQKAEDDEMLIRLIKIRWCLWT